MFKIIEAGEYYRIASLFNAGITNDHIELYPEKNPSLYASYIRRKFFPDQGPVQSLDRAGYLREHEDPLRSWRIAIPAFSGRERMDAINSAIAFARQRDVVCFDIAERDLVAARGFNRVLYAPEHTVALPEKGYHLEDFLIKENHNV